MKTRKSNKAKHYSKGCGNHGSCLYCRDSRTHSNRKRAPGPLSEALAEIEQEYTPEERARFAYTIRSLTRHTRG